MGTRLVSSKGRMFWWRGWMNRRSETWNLINQLVAYSAHNGRALWRREMPLRATAQRSSMVAHGDHLYVEDNDGVLVLDGETGSEVRRITFDGFTADLIKWVAIADNRLYVMGGAPDPLPSGSDYPGRPHRFLWKLGPGRCGYGRQIAAYDLAANRWLWTHTEPADIGLWAVAASGGDVDRKSVV